jgi:hypothetical protein
LDGKHCGTDGRLYLEMRARVHVLMYLYVMHILIEKKLRREPNT